MFAYEERLPTQVSLGRSELKELSFNDWASWSFNMLMGVVNLWVGRVCVCWGGGRVVLAFGEFI